MNLADRFSGLLVRGDEDQLNVRMKQQNAQQLRAAITGATENAYDFWILLRHLLSRLKRLSCLQDKLSKQDFR